MKEGGENTGNRVQSSSDYQLEARRLISGPLNRSVRPVSGFQNKDQINIKTKFFFVSLPQGVGPDNSGPLTNIVVLKQYI